MPSTNPLIPLAAQALEQAQERGLPITARTLHELMDENVHALYSALDVSIACQRLKVLSIGTVLSSVGPAVATANGYEHIDDDSDPVKLEGVLSLREAQLADLAASRDAIRDRIALARLRHDVEAGVELEARARA